MGNYHALHKWINKHYGRASKCEMCKKKGRRYEWAKLKGKRYAYNVENFIQLCNPCHHVYDNIGEKVRKTKSKRHYVAWNKGLKMSKTNKNKNNAHL